MIKTFKENFLQLVKVGYDYATGSGWKNRSRERGDGSSPCKNQPRLVDLYTRLYTIHRVDSDQNSEYTKCM